MTAEEMRVAAKVKYRNAHLRLDTIAARLDAAGFHTIAELAQLVGVSEMTVRRDVAVLAADGRARLSHGGVHSTRILSAAHTLHERQARNWTAKDAIGRQCAAMIEQNDSVAIDAGSTALCILAHLDRAFSGSIITHSVPALVAAMEHGRARIIALGGDVRRDSAAMIGPIAADTAARLRVRRFFLGAAAIDARGLYGVTDTERPTKQALMDIADQVVLLADHTKFAHSAPALIAPLAALDILVTDRPPPRPIAEALAEAKVAVVLAGPPV
ncbi:MAG: DeoR/GlpR transcriptional regulator [Rhodospirillales bacterium]|nr:DeoR/GlpR transcriptional regulator [Rhodospirillales bacterium]